MTRRPAAACLALLFWAGLAGAGQLPPPDATDSSGGWRPTTENAWRGTGENFGSGWRRDASGRMHGTGDNFGRGWRPESDGGWSGTGKNFGRGWGPRTR